MKIQRNIINAVIRDARERAPIEACGYLGEKGSVVDTIIRIKNTANSPTRYAFDPQEQLMALKKAEREKWELVAVYHSHLDSPAYPSNEDIRLAFYGDIYYLIVSLRDEPPDFGVFRIKDETISQENLVITER